MIKYASAKSIRKKSNMKYVPCILYTAFLTVGAVEKDEVRSSSFPTALLIVQHGDRQNFF